MRILVTGANGFVGRHLVRRLLLNHEVIGSSRSSTKISVGKSKLLKVYQLDIVDRLRTYELIRKVKPDWVVHLAAQSSPRISWQKPELTWLTNGVGTINLLNAIYHSSPATGFLFVSTNLVYGSVFRSNCQPCETTRCIPENPYAASKLMGEFSCLDYFNRGLKIIIGRPFNHAGPGQDSSFVFSDWCRQVALAERGLGPRVLNVGNITACRDFLHVEDVVSSYELLLKKGNQGHIYNICSSRSVPLSDYVHFLTGLSRVPIKVHVDHGRYRKEDPKKVSGCSKKIRGLGWEPKKSAFDALKETLDAYRQSKEI